MGDELPTQVERLANLLGRARHVCVLTGAGISAESGLSTFRGDERDMKSLWSSFKPEDLATPQAFARDPAGVSAWYEWRRQGCLRASPNAGHVALAVLEQRLVSRGGRFTLLTQNVDRLHHRVGSVNVVELHGNITQWRCTRTKKLIELPPEEITVFPMPSPYASDGVLRPSVVWFGEALPEEAVLAADEAARDCDVFMAIGTSAVVYPAAGFIEVAAMHGARTVEINPQSTGVSELVSLAIRASASAVLPGAVGGLREGAEHE